MEAFLSALLLQAGYNTALVTLGSAMLGASAAAIGTFVLLRKRSLVSDAISHATLPGLCLAFITMAALTGDGRWITGLMIGAAGSAGLGLLIVEWISRRTRLSEDAAIGAVLSVFFGFGIVLLTVIQSLDTGGQAGISGYLVGSTASMLRSEAETIALGALLSGAAIFVLRRPFTLICFDPEYAAVRGVNLRATDLAMMTLLLAVTVIGLKVAGLVLIVALTIIPPVAARFWTDRGLPTGSLIVLVAFALFVVSMLVSPRRGLLARTIERRLFQIEVHERQGLLARANDTPIYDALTLRVLRCKGFIRGDGVATLEGRGAAAEAVRDEARWALFRKLNPEEAAGMAHQGVTSIARALPADVVADLDQRLSLPGGQA